MAAEIRGLCILAALGPVTCVTGAGITLVHLWRVGGEVGASQRLELISVSDFQRNAFILGLLSLLLLNSGRSILKVMVITSIIFLISFLSEIHFCRVKKEWCERGLISEGKP